MSDRIHVYPLDIKKQNGRWTSSHCTDNTEMCGCKPEVMQGCRECCHLKDPDPKCWRCGGRGLELPYDIAMAYIIVHRQYPTGTPCFPYMPDEKLRAK